MTSLSRLSRGSGASRLSLAMRSTSNVSCPVPVGSRRSKVEKQPAAFSGQAASIELKRAALVDSYKPRCLIDMSVWRVLSGRR